MTNLHASSPQPIDWLALLRVEPSALEDDQRQDLERVAKLCHNSDDESRALALALLCNVLGRVNRFHPVSLPFGYERPDLAIRHEGWLLREDLRRFAAQITGLVQPSRSLEACALHAERACDMAVRLGLLETRDYDAWRPGMPSGSGWRIVVRATALVRTRLLTHTVSASTSDHARGPDESGWLTVTEAADLLRKDISGIDLAKAKARVSKAANEEKFRTNGETGTSRRICRDSFSTWRLEQREKDLAAYD